MIIAQRITLVLTTWMIFIGCGLLNNRSQRNSINISFVGKQYYFSDNGDRHIFIHFISDSSLTIKNVTDIPQHYKFMSYNATFKYKKIDVATVYVTSELKSSKDLPDNHSYLLPNEKKSYKLNSDAINQIMPNIKNDTIRFGNNFLNLQLREFKFDYYED